MTAAHSQRVRSDEVYGLHETGIESYRLFGGVLYQVRFRCVTCAARDGSGPFGWRRGEADAHLAETAPKWTDDQGLPLPPIPLDLSVGCEYCKVPAGRACKDNRGSRTQLPHKDRTDRLHLLSASGLARYVMIRDDRSLSLRRGDIIVGRQEAAVDGDFVVIGSGHTHRVAASSFRWLRWVSDNSEMSAL